MPDNDARIADLERRMERVEEGVSNFRRFQDRASSFFAAHDAREDERDKIDRRRAKIHFALLTAVLTLITGCAVIMFQMWAEGHKVVTLERPISQAQQQPQSAKE